MKNAANDGSTQLSHMGLKNLWVLLGLHIFSTCFSFPGSFLFEGEHVFPHYPFLSDFRVNIYLGSSFFLQVAFLNYTPHMSLVFNICQGLNSMVIPPLKGILTVGI